MKTGVIDVGGGFRGTFAAGVLDCCLDQKISFDLGIGISAGSAILCGVCAKVCPANNITVTDKVTFSDRCEVCYACLHNCPQNAIHMKVEQSPVRFRNEHVSLRDIIQANE